MGPNQEFSTPATYTVDGTVTGGFITSGSGTTLTVDGTGTGGYITTDSGTTLRVASISESSFTPWIELKDARSELKDNIDVLGNRLNVLEQSVYQSEAAITRLTEAVTKLCRIIAEQSGVKPPECDMSAIMRFIDSIPVKE